MPSLAVGGGDKEDASAGDGDEATDVRERALVLVPEAKAIRGYEQHHGLGERGERPRGSGRHGHDAEVWAEQDEGRDGGEGHSEEEQEAGE